MYDDAMKETDADETPESAEGHTPELEEGHSEVTSISQPAASGYTPRGRPRSAPEILLRRWWIVALGAILVAAITYGISRVVPPTYSSSAEVALLVSGVDVNDATLGANNLAAQYAQEVNSTQVLQSAGSQLGGLIPSSSVTGGPVAAQNLIAIQATASSASLAQRRASAVANAFIVFIEREQAKEAAQYQQQASAQLRPLNAQIAQTRASLARAGSPTSARAVGLEQALTTLLTQRAVAQGTIAENSVAGRPTVTLVSSAGLGGQTVPRPKLYALIAFVLGLLIIARLVVYFGVRSRSV